MAKTSTVQTDVDARVYDFSKPMKLPREYARIMEMALEAFTRHWVNQLVGRLHVVITGEVGDLSMRSYDDYIQTLPTQTLMVIIDFQGAVSYTHLTLPTTPYV